MTGRDITYNAPARSPQRLRRLYALRSRGAAGAGDPEAYPADRARAIEPRAGCATSVEISRQGGRAAAYIPGDGRDFRMTAVDFPASMQTRQLNAAQLAENRRAALSRDHGVKPGLQARDDAGISTADRDSPLLAELTSRCEGPVGCSPQLPPNLVRPRETMATPCAARGVEAIDLGVSIDNVDRLMRDEALVEQIAALRTIILTGGNQIRPVETLLYRGRSRHC